jgi:hypothetical protein
VLLFVTICICKCTDGEGNGSANQSAFYAQPNLQHSLQPSPTSLKESVELQGEEGVQVSLTNSKAHLYSWYDRKPRELIKQLNKCHFLS